MNKLVEHLSSHDRANEAAEAMHSNLLTHHCGGECGASFASEEEVIFHQMTSGHHQQLTDSGQVNLDQLDNQNYIGSSSRHQDSIQVRYTYKSPLASSLQTWFLCHISVI